MRCGAMTEVLIYTASGILLYVLADAALKALEKMHGEPIPYRSVIFFVIIFMMAMVLFQVINMIFNSDPAI
jgi:hypothetical protein